MKGHVLVGLAVLSTTVTVLIGWAWFADTPLWWVGGALVSGGAVLGMVVVVSVPAPTEP